MPRLRTSQVASIVRRILIYGGYGLGALMCVALVTIWLRGRIQEARVAALLAAVEDASIQAEYGPYRYVPRPGLCEPPEPGTLTLVLGKGQRVHGFGVAGHPPPYLEPLIPIFGEHCFARVTDIAIHSEHFSDKNVDLLLAFPDVRAIDLSNTAITDEGFIRLISGTKLVELDVSGTKVSAAAMRRLANCTELMELGLSDPSHETEIESELQRVLPDCWVHD